LLLVLGLEIGLHKDVIKSELTNIKKYVKRNLGRFWNEKVVIPGTYKNIGTSLDKLYDI
jgi:hypothetical protein